MSTDEQPTPTASAPPRTVELRDRRASTVTARRGRRHPRRVRASRASTRPTLCYARQPHAGQRLPGVRRRGRGRARRSSRVLAQGRDGMEVADRHRARAHSPQAGARAARLVGRPVDRRPNVARLHRASTTRRPERFGPPAPPVRGRRARRARRRPPPRRRTADTRADGRTSRSKVDNELYVRDYSQVHPLLQVRRGLRRPTRRTPSRSPSPAAASTPASRPSSTSRCRVGVRLLRQLHRRLPDRRADVQVRVRHARGRHWDEAEQTVTDTICPYCGVGCTLDAARAGQRRSSRSRRRIDHDVTRGHLCIKGRFGWEWVNRRE